MSVQVFCPKCDRSCRIKEDFLGRRVRCPGCEEIFRAEEVPVAEADPEPTDIPPPHLQEFFPDASSPRVKRLDKKTDEPSRGRRGDGPLLKPGSVENPFSEGSGLASSAPVDSSLFAFDYGDEPPIKHKESSERRGKTDPRDDDRKKSSRRDRDEADEDDDEETRDRGKADAPDTEYGWKGRKSPPDQLPAKPGAGRADEKGKRPAKPSAPGDSGSPFSFDDADEKPSREMAPKPQEARRNSDEKRSERPLNGAMKKNGAPSAEVASPFRFEDTDEGPAHESAPKQRSSRREIEEERDEKPVRSAPKKNAVQNDDAAFLGLENEGSVPHETVEPKPKKKSGKRRFFHVRQSGFWSEVRLFRVFIHEGDLVFISAVLTGGKEVAETEEAIESGSLKQCDRKIRNRLIDLDELPIEELAENDRNGFRSTAEKIVAASIDAPPRTLIRKHGAAVLRLEHKSKGVMQFELLEDDDVDRAIDYLPDLIDDVSEINVRWDKAKECFVAR